MCISYNCGMQLLCRNVGWTLQSMKCRGWASDGQLCCDHAKREMLRPSLQALLLRAAFVSLRKGQTREVYCLKELLS